MGSLGEVPSRLCAGEGLVGGGEDKEDFGRHVFQLSGKGGSGMREKWNLVRTSPSPSNMGAFIGLHRCKLIRKALDIL